MAHRSLAARLQWRLGALARRFRKPSRLSGQRVTYAMLRAMTQEGLRAHLASASPAEAARWVSAAAENGVKSAPIVYGQMLIDGHGVARDPEAALRWFRIAANSGNVEGINMVGRCHELGFGVPADPAEAARWYAAAAERGFDWAQFNLAELMIAGNGIPADRRQALRWYLRAARQGHAKAMNMLGRYCEEGWTSRARPQAAFRWYRRSAQRGDFRGAFNYARRLSWQGCKDEALPWLRHAIDNGIPSFCREAAPDLCASTDPELRDIGRRALARACESGDATDLARFRNADKDIVAAHA